MGRKNKENRRQSRQDNQAQRQAARQARLETRQAGKGSRVGQRNTPEAIAARQANVSGLLDMGGSLVSSATGLMTGGLMGGGGGGLGEDLEARLGGPAPDVSKTMDYETRGGWGDADFKTPMIVAGAAAAGLVLWSMK